MQKLFIQRSDGALATYSGMTQDQITSSLATMGLKCTFIDETTYSSALAALQVRK